MKAMKQLLIFPAMLFFVLSATAQTKLDYWWFYRAEIGSPWEAFRSEKISKLPHFEEVTVPHCYNALDAVDPEGPYYQGPAWYYTFVKVSNPYQNGRTLLHFEGVGQSAEVYVFMTKVGEHTGGYDEWSVDITDAVKQYLKKYPNGTGRVPEGSIPIAVRADNSRDVNRIPSDLSDFTLYGGIYRKVWLEYYPKTCMTRLFADYTLDKKLKTAKLTLKALFNLETSDPVNIKITVKDKNGKEVGSLSEMVTPSDNKKTVLGSLQVKKVHLWSPEDPYLYTIEAAMEKGKDRQVKKIKIGFRKFEFIEKGPFVLNGKRLLLKGTSLHEDHAGYGAAVPDSILRRTMIMMKEMGVNFIRLGHYQHPEYVLQLCDSLGILAWEEIPWCRGGIGGEAYQAQAENMLTNLITQHYNHPSIIIWGLGNENDWPGDFPTFLKDSIIAFMQQLNTLAHTLDPSRKTAIRRCDFCKQVVDVYSPSIWAGWYRGKYTTYKEVSYREAMTVDHFLHAEWGASMQAGRHSEDPDKGLAQISDQTKADERAGDFLLTGGEPRVSKDGDWSETYGCNLIDWTLKEQETMDWLTGSAFWIFKDFATPLRPDNPIPYVNEKGVTQRDLTPKEAYYVFQSYWSEKPMAHIYGHSWETRWGEPGENKLLKVYSNCDQAELFLNGKSLGRRKRDSQNFPAAGLRWKTQFKEGKNVVKVIAQKGKATVTDSITFIYQTTKWEKPDHLIIEKTAREGTTVTVCIKAYDRNHVFCPDAKNFVRFGVTGRAELQDDLGTLLGSRKIQLSNGKACIKVKLYEKAVLSVRTADMETVFLKLSAE
jgi:beta-galactosidase